MIDFTDDSKKASDDNLEKLTELAENYKELTDNLARIQQAEKDVKSEIKRISENAIPDIMEECGMTEFKTDKLTISIKDVLEASIPTLTGISRAKDDDKKMIMECRRVAAFNWLDENNGSQIIKNEFAFLLPKGSDESKLDELKEFAGEVELPYSHDQKVHAGTLKAFLKEKMANGDDVPFDTFNVYVAKVAKIK